jgi:uncharacterized cofD-like protein
MTNPPKNIVTIGGGSGQFALLSGLRDLEGIRISAVVSMVDSGGSTGRLRDELGTLPPGDILKCILALSPHREAARSILQKRFYSNRRLRGHNAGNMLITMLSQYTGSFPEGVKALAEILDVRGAILPVTVSRATLVAELTDGTRIFGESAIDIPRGNQRERIRDVFMVPHHDETIAVYPPVLDAIQQADLIIIGPGDLFTSIIPNLIVPGVRESLCQTSAKLFYVVNIMTKFGETRNFRGVDFVTKLEEFTGRAIDGLICNTQKPGAEIRNRYREQKSDLVDIVPENPETDARTVYAADLLDTTGGIIRHDSEKLAALIRTLIDQDCRKGASDTERGPVLRV